MARRFPPTPSASRFPWPAAHRAPGYASPLRRTSPPHSLRRRSSQKSPLCLPLLFGSSSLRAFLLVALALITSQRFAADQCQEIPPAHRRSLTRRKDCRALSRSDIAAPRPHLHALSPALLRLLLSAGNITSSHYRPWRPAGAPLITRKSSLRHELWFIIRRNGCHISKPQDGTPAPRLIVPSLPALSAYRFIVPSIYHHSPRSCSSSILASTS